MAVTVLLLLPGITAMIYTSVKYENHIPLKVGIDYTGGTILQYGVDKKLNNDDLAQTRENLQKVGVENPNLQILDDNGKSIISIRTKFIDAGDNLSEQISQTITKEYTGAQLVQVSSVGPTLGKELFKHSLIAVTLACLCIVAYLSIRFRFDYALAAILGIAHDILFVIGIFSILGLFYNVQVDGLFITALLTVMGFSVHDTIVVFDRIRENLRYYSKKMSFGEIVDVSVNQTFARSINTSLTVLLTLGALYLFGGVTTKDFVLTMLLGVAVGTYSSIFFCSILVDFWNEQAEPASSRLP
jgi:preprotein translocase subunit SecF